MTRQEVKENRLKFANGLLEPHRMKFKRMLENLNNPNERCCLGHGCEIFGIIRGINNYDVVYGVEQHAGVAPKELIKILGLYYANGSSFNEFEIAKGRSSLAGINDHTELTTQQIGQLILDKGWIEGGEDTPFKPLEDYPEA